MIYVIVVALELVLPCDSTVHGNAPGYLNAYGVIDDFLFQDNLIVL